MNNNIIIQLNKLNKWEIKLIEEISRQRTKLNTLCLLYDNPKQTKAKDIIYEKLSNIYCKLDDYNIQLNDLLGYYINDLLDCCEYEIKITNRIIKKANTSKKYICEFIVKLNRNIIKIKKICINEGLDYNKYCSKELLENIEEWKSEYIKIIDSIIKEYNERGDV